MPDSSAEHFIDLRAPGKNPRSFPNFAPHIGQSTRPRFSPGDMPTSPMPDEAPAGAVHHDIRNWQHPLGIGGRQQKRESSI